MPVIPALIIPIDPGAGSWGGAPLPWPTPPIYYPPSVPPGIWGGAPLPPTGIWPGPGQPPGIWGGAPIGPNPPQPGHGLPGLPPGIWPSPGYPAHPIAPGGLPPGIWGGGGMPVPTPPIFLPPGTIPGTKPEHPIYIPPSIWPSPGVPTHPIVLPPPGSDEKPEILGNWEAKTYWSPTTGWGVAIVPSEEHEGVPTPSK